MSDTTICLMAHLVAGYPDERGAMAVACAWAASGSVAQSRVERIARSIRPHPVS